MRYQLDPFSPNGLAVLTEQPKITNRGGFAGSPDITRVLQPGTNVTFTGNGTQQSPYVVNSSGGGSGSGITRTISVISSNTNAAASSTTDYVYIASGTITLTLPTASSNTNAYGIKNSGTGIITVATTSAQTIDGNSNIMLTTNQFITVYSNGSNWIVGA